MKNRIRNSLAATSSMFEGIISIFILLGTFIAVGILFVDLTAMIGGMVSGFRGITLFQDFLATAIQLIIAIEFVKMLAKHTPGSVIEVLLVVISKRVIVEQITLTDTLIGVLAIGLLFLIKRYVFTSDRKNSFASEVIIDADTTLTEFNSNGPNKIPENLGDTLEEVIVNEFKRVGREMRVHESIKIGKLTLIIHSVENGIIKEIEVTGDSDFPRD